MLAPMQPQVFNAAPEPAPRMQEPYMQPQYVQPAMGPQQAGYPAPFPVMQLPPAGSEQQQAPTLLQPGQQLTVNAEPQAALAPAPNAVHFAAPNDEAAHDSGTTAAPTAQPTTSQRVTGMFNRMLTGMLQFAGESPTPCVHARVRVCVQPAVRSAPYATYALAPLRANMQASVRRPCLLQTVRAPQRVGHSLTAPRRQTCSHRQPPQPPHGH